jgi:hypothetical protein
MRTPCPWANAGSLILIITLSLPVFETSVAAAQSAPSPDEKSLSAIRRRVEETKAKLGDQAGVPELPDRYEPIPKGGRWLSAAEAHQCFKRLQDEIERRRWWKIGLDPTHLNHALREAASVVCGCVQAARSGLADTNACLRLAREAGDFLIWAQQQAGTGVIPFPAYRGESSDNAFRTAARYLARAERADRLNQVVTNGWIFDDSGDGGLQFDNGEGGAALFELNEITKDPKYFDAAIRTADWVAARPVAPNWNYNSFSVYLLARAYAVTGDQKYLAVATAKARLGVLPGQLTDGPRAGRWLDPHNARPAYHYIMVRGLAQLAAVLPKDDPARPELIQALKLGLHARNQDLLGPGAANKDNAMEALLLVNHAFAGDKDFLRDSLSSEALELVGKLVSEQARRGKLPLSPRAWGMFLAEVARRSEH